MKLNQGAIEPKHWPKITNIHRDVFEPFDLLAQLPQLDDNMQAPGTDSDEMEDVMLEDSAKQQEPVQEPGQEPVQEPPKKKGRQKPLSQKTLASISETVDAEMESIFNSVTTGAAVARKEGANDGGGNASK